MVLAMHREALAEFGGSDGIRDEGLLESALARPQQHENYDKPTLFDLAALYCEGIVRNHPFVDGNKRTGFLAAYAFLRINGYQLNPEEMDIFTVITALAEKRIDKKALSKWFADYSVPVKAGGS